MNALDTEPVPRAAKFVAHGYALLTMTAVIAAMFVLQPADRVVPLLTFLGFFPFLIPVLLVGVYFVLLIVGRLFSHFLYFAESAAQAITSTVFALAVAAAMLALAVA